MARPHFMIAIGLPGSPHGENDEDSLDREQDGNGDDDLATEAIVSIVKNLHHGGPSAVRTLRRFTSALDAICEAFMSRDNQGVEEAAGEARDVLNDMLSG
jgi:streptomycin 6-kinase